MNRKPTRSRRKGLLATLAGALALAWAAPRADAAMTVEAIGQAAGYDRDSEATTRRAMDDAVRQAVDQAIGEIVDPAARKSHAEVLKTRVLKRAKAYVRASRVLKEGLVDGLWQVHLEVDVDDDALRRDLAALKVPLAGVAGLAPPPEVAPARPRVLVVIVSDRAKDPATATLDAAASAALRQRGADVASVLTVESPRDDEHLAAEAVRAGAGKALVLALGTTRSARIRGTPLEGAEVELLARVIVTSPAGRVFEERVRAGGSGAYRSATGGGLGDAEKAALGEVAALAITRAAPSLVPARAAARSGAVRIRLVGVVRWQDVQAVVKAVAAVPGVTGVRVGELERGTVTLDAAGGVSGKAVARALPPLGEVRASDAQIDVIFVAAPPPAEVTPPAGEGRP